MNKKNDDAFLKSISGALPIKKKHKIKKDNPTYNFKSSEKKIKKTNISTPKLTK